MMSWERSPSDTPQVSMFASTPMTSPFTGQVSSRWYWIPADPSAGEASSTMAP